MDMDHECLVAVLELPMIEATLDGTIMVTGIIDSGCQVVIICSDIWERLRTPMKHEQVMFMELANRKSIVTMGTIPSICFSAGEVSLYCLVKVVRNAPFECLLSLPFMSLASTKCQEFPDGSTHLLFTDQTQGHPLWFQPTLNSLPRVVTCPVLMRSILNWQ